MKFTIEPMNLGDILSRAFRVLFSRLGVFIAIELIMVAPTLTLQLLLPDVAVGGGAVFLILPMIILGPIGSAAMLHVITQEYLGEPVSLGGAFQFAIGRFLPLLGTSILVGLGLILGFMACCIPGIYFAICWAFASQVVVMENLSGAEALGRSRSLVQGYFWHVFGVLFVVSLMVGVPGWIAGAILPNALPFQAADAQNPFLRVGPVTNFANFAVHEIIVTTLNGVLQAFQAICATLLYFDLRNRKEAFDVGHIVAWMDQYRTWRDEPDVMPPPSPGPAGAPETGIKDPGAGPLPPETGIKPDSPEPPPTP
jgi:hypothetical protein